MPPPLSSARISSAEPSRQRPHDQLTATRVLDEVRPQLVDEERQLLPGHLTEPDPCGELHDAAAGFSDLTAVADRAEERILHARHSQRAMRTRVPCSGTEEISNSFDSRLAPPRPRPRPEPVV